MVLKLDKELSWLEVRLKVPRNWDLISDSGGINEAYMRIDSPSSVKLEVKWEKIGKKSELLPYLALDNYIKSITKEAKQKTSYRVLEKGNVTVCEHKGAYYIWKFGATTFATLSWICEQESKVFLLQYTFDENENKQENLPEILKNFLCHWNHGFYEYKIFGVSFNVPKEFHLFKRKFALGRAEMNFTSSDSNIFISWLGLASLQIKKHGSLGGVVRNILADSIKSFDGSFSELLNRVKISDNFISLSVEKKSKFPFKKSKFLSLYSRFDENSNKVFLVAYKTMNPDKRDVGSTVFSELKGSGE